MWIYALGKYQVTKDKKDGFYFRLNSKEVTGEYRIDKMKEKEWLLERVDDPQLNYLHQEIAPMLSETSTQPPVNKDYVFELKWDGIRALIALEDGQLKIRTRNQNDVTQQFPELQIGEKAFALPMDYLMPRLFALTRVGSPYSNVL